jgi:hypothetical protein
MNCVVSREGLEWTDGQFPVAGTVRGWSGYSRAPFTVQSNNVEGRCKIRSHLPRPWLAGARSTTASALPADVHETGSAETSTNF